MSAESPAPLDKRLEAMGRTFASLFDLMAEEMLRIGLRSRALQDLLVAKGFVTEEEVAAQIQALSDAATLQVEYGDKPEHEEFRRLRRLIEDRLKQPPEGTES
jgi:hypothetical protein